jgi:anion-transporting  ArsA/GET3 family ATPase
MSATLVPDPAAGPRLHVVTGKGGTGKTTVAASIALALASQAKTVLLCEVEGRQGIASLFDVPPLPYEERRIVVAPGGAELRALAIDAESALLDYLAMFYKLGTAGKALDKFGVIDFVTTVAPGTRDVLLTGKVYEAARRNRRGRPVYDAVVLDAPPTGRIARFLNVNTEVAGLAKIGRIRNQANSIMNLLQSPDTTVHLVTILEEMPVQETVDGIEALREINLNVGSIVVNQVRDSVLDEGTRTAAIAKTLDAVGIERQLKEAGLDLAADEVESLLVEAREHAERVEMEDGERDRLGSLGMPLSDLPLVPDGVDLSVLYDFAAQLREDGIV